eukprot:6210454-Pleurochrysis_carterae.AAC.3
MNAELTKASDHIAHPYCRFQARDTDMMGYPPLAANPEPPHQLAFISERGTDTLVEDSRAYRIW